MTDDKTNVTDFTEARVRRATSKVKRALVGLSEEDAKLVIEDALRRLGSDLKVEEKKP